MTARTSLLSMSMIACLPGLAMAALGAMGGISGASGLLLITYWIAAVVGGVLALMPVLIFSGVFPKTAGGKSKAKASAAKAAPGKASKKAAAVEPASEEMDVAEDDEFAEASDEFSAVSDDELDFGVADEFDEEEEK